jgi:putative oxidoreductase
LTGRPGRISFTIVQDLGKFILRLTVAGLILFHGVDKIVHGIAWIQGPLADLHLPSWVAYGVYAGEVVAPLFLLAGIGARAAALVIVVNMIMAVLLDAHAYAFTLGTGGAWGLEREAFYFFGAVACACLGPGRFRITLGRTPPAAGTSPTAPVS